MSEKAENTAAAVSTAQDNGLSGGSLSKMFRSDPLMYKKKIAL